jgi:hypothetical protein
MFPTQELNALAHCKRMIRARIARERFACSTALEAVARPLRWIDRLHARWRSVPALLKLATVPVAFFLKRRLFPRKARRSVLARWLPLAWRIVRGVCG